ncbi:hypothetical protein Ocin01_08608 [Orchesella cincta]|uniref:F-box domain-containing protein n=1 Tax=Orchesella cincta TaxID=48709 RepID=A0A1D2MZ23_ORCCI|nr:hypothetical protein Ocin01_08608 [Orchesella cincta]
MQIRKMLMPNSLSMGQDKKEEIWDRDDSFHNDFRVSQFPSNECRRPFQRASGFDGKLKKPPQQMALALPKQAIFNIEGLPVELKHEILKKIKTEYLELVCAQVSTHWSDMVGDIIRHRAARVDRIVPSFLRPELESRLPPDQRMDPVHLLKLYERSVLRNKIDVTSVLISSDILNPRKGIISKVRQIRHCDCPVLDECIVRAIHLMPAFNLFIVLASTGLKFFHLLDLDRHLDNNNVSGDVREFTCLTSGTWFRDLACSEISVLGEEIVAQETTRVLLLLKVTSCDTEHRQISLERVRNIYLPLWSRSLCLLNDRVLILYTSGFVGMWDRTLDELFISPAACENQRDSQAQHLTRMFRVSSLVFIKTQPDETCRWYVLDPSDPNVEVHGIEMAELVTAGFLHAEPQWECTEVYYIEFFCNSFIVHCQGKSENRLLIKRMKRYPIFDDFRTKGAFRNSFISEFENRTKSVVLNGTIISPFLPPNLRPWQLDPRVSDPIPVADMISIEWDRRRRRRLKLYRIRIANLPEKPSGALR